MKKEKTKIIVLLGTLDTKGLEIGFVREKIQARGHKTIVVDAGVLGQPQVKADIRREDVAKAGGKSLEELLREAQKSSDRMPIIQVMIAGAAQTVKNLYQRGKLDGLLSVGGSMGMAIGAGAAKGLPVGVPKLILGTHFYPQYLGEADLTIMQSPTDIMGLNPVTNLALAQAAGAICAMTEESGPMEKTRPLVAMTGLGVTTPAVMSLQKLLEEKGYDTVVFHGNSEAMDQLIDEGLIDGVLDFSPNELIRIFILEETPQRASRLEPAGRKGLPQVIVPGSLDMIVLRMAKDAIPDRYRNRKIYLHGPHVTGVRTSREELRRLAGVVSEKANRATGPLAVVFPRGGFSAIDREGRAFYEPETNRAFLEGLQENLKAGVEVIEVDAHLFDEDFLTEVARVYDEIAKKGGVHHG
jgi:uncharacterized protein (UPF0261 family)